MSRRARHAAVLLVLAALVVCAWVVVERHLIARSVLAHPVVGTVTTLAEAEGWTVLAERVVRPGPFEPLWLAGMIDAPFRRELVFVSPGSSAEELGPAVSRALFGAGGWPPDEPHDGVHWRTSRITSTLSLSPAAAIDRARTRGSYLGYPAETTRVRRTRRIAVEVAAGHVAVSVEGGKRPSAGASIEPRSFIGRTEPLPWDAPAGAPGSQASR